MKHVKTTVTNAGYKVMMKVLDTSDHGIPQSRERAYIVAMDRAHKSKHAFHWPQPVKMMSAMTLMNGKNVKVGTAPCNSDMSRKNIEAALSAATLKGLKPKKVPIFVDVGSSTKWSHWKEGTCLCITKARGSNGGHYVSTHNRKMSIDELFRFQGIRPDDVPWKESQISATNIGGAIGNAMSANVLMRLVPRVLLVVGIIPAMPLDKFEDPAYIHFAYNLTDDE